MKRFQSPSRNGRRPPAAMSLIELLAVMAIMTVIMALTVNSYRSLADSVEISNGIQQISDSLNLARQIATSKNEYAQVRFYAPRDGADFRQGQYTALGVYRADAPLYGTAPEYQLWEDQGRLRRAAPLARLAGGCVALKDPTYSPLLEKLSTLGLSGTEKLSDGVTYDWVGFYFKPDGSTDLDATMTTNGLSVCSLKSFQAQQKLPPSYGAITVDPVIGRCQIIRP